MDFNQTSQCKYIIAGSVSCFETGFQFFISRNDKTGINYSEDMYIFFSSWVFFKEQLLLCAFLSMPELKFFEAHNFLLQ